MQYQNPQGKTEGIFGLCFWKKKIHFKRSCGKLIILKDVGMSVSEWKFKENTPISFHFLQTAIFTLSESVTEALEHIVFLLRWNIEISGTCIMAWNETFVKIMYVKHKKRDWTVTFIFWKSRSVLSYNSLFQITDRTVCWNITGFSVDTMFAVRHSKSVFTQSPLLLMSTLFLPQWDIMWNDMLSLSSLIW